MYLARTSFPPEYNYSLSLSIVIRVIIQHRLEYTLKQLVSKLRYHLYSNLLEFLVRHHLPYIVESHLQDFVSEASIALRRGGVHLCDDFAQLGRRDVAHALRA